MAPLEQVNRNDQTIAHEGRRHQSVTQEDSGAISGSTAFQGTILGLDDDGNPALQFIGNVGDRH